jgi:TonB family protein
MINHSWLAEFSIAVWPALAQHLWQATIVAGLCLMALPAFRNAGAKARHGLWALAFVRFAIPQALIVFAADHLSLHPALDRGMGIRLQQVSSTVVRVTQPSIWIDPKPAAIGSVPSGHSEVYCILTIIWIAGSVLLLSRWWLRQFRFARSLRTAGREVGNELMHTLESLKDRLGIRRRARLRVVWRDSEAGVFGVWHPTLVLPEEMPGQLSPDEVRAVLAHELVHVARWDNLWSNLQMILCCVFWFHPVVWLLDRRLTAEQERSCDERVIAVLRNSQAYVSGLIKMTNIGLGLRIAGVSSMAGSNLKRRIEDMKDVNVKSGLPARILFYSVASFTVLLYLVAVPHHQSLAQSTPFNLTIENSDKSALKIVSATVENISISPRPTTQVAAQLINPKIVVKNNSDRIAYVYALEFRKAGSHRLYLNRHPVELKPNGTDSIERSEFLWTAGEIAADAGKAWTVRLVSMAFKDGSHITLPPAPIPPPAGVWEITEATQPSGLGHREPIKAGGSMPGSKLIRRVEPIYPEEAKREHVQGLVILTITVDEEGNVTNAVVSKGHPFLNDAAVTAVKQWKYSPTFLNGKPVPVMATVTVKFDLR